MITDKKALVTLWPKIEPHIQRALDVYPGLYEPIDILLYALSGTMVIWVAVTEKDIEAAMVTRIIDHPRKRVCDVPYIAGANMAGWANQFMEKSEAYARAMGCAAMSGSSRRGWVKFGYKEMGVMLLKELPPVEDDNNVK
jgi:hypothetical protein